ncbi:DUF5681 domain-containing protein [Desulfovibrio sp. SGI.169]|uniref:DUF5681 domain-containing protein n=1 Tax=Desulfovibrio sp. SGI.169 TaxID=3420561 RepID=UPI003D081226
MPPEKTGKKQGTTQFRPGQSGNPKGRPTGALNRATIAAQALLDGEAEALTRAAVELALQGNVQALKLCLERICPARKERPLSLALPEVEGAADLSRLTAAILGAVARGELETGQAAALASLVTAHGKALELTELEQRISALEKQNEHAERIDQTH